MNMGYFLIYSLAVILFFIGLIPAASYSEYFLAIQMLVVLLFLFSVFYRAKYLIIGNCAIVILVCLFAVVANFHMSPYTPMSYWLIYAVLNVFPLALCSLVVIHVLKQQQQRKL